MIQQWREKIRPLDERAMKAAADRWDSIAKPLGSLGKLERLVIRMAGIMGTPAVEIEDRTLLVCCADNGVIAQGVSQSDAHVTAVVSQNIAQGRGNVSLLCRRVGCRCLAVNAGIREEVDCPQLLDCRIRPGTDDITRGPAMTREEALRAVETGVRLAKEQKEQGCRLLLTGEMGIGNTTTSAAVLSVLLGRPARELVGRGAGLSREGLVRKEEAVSRAILVNRPNPQDGVDVLSKSGRA